MTIMTRLTKRIVWLALLLVWGGNATAFSLLGPFKVDNSFTGGDWQAAGYGGRNQGLGYTIPGSIGGPMFAFEAYRWNVPTITYAFDSTFLRYFGPRGVEAVEEAIAILNALPPASQMSPTLTEFALDTKAENGTAADLGLFDLKSYTLRLLLEELGLASPERFVWNLLTREIGTNPNFTNYTVIQLNYDPVTSSHPAMSTACSITTRFSMPLACPVPSGQARSSGINWIPSFSLTLRSLGLSRTIFGWVTARERCSTSPQA